jgi:nicotinamidase-related amidase
VPDPAAQLLTCPAAPGPFTFRVENAALLVIDMQGDFLLPGGFGELLGNDTRLLSRVVEPTRRLLAAARERGMLIVHTREGHLPDLSDCPDAKWRRSGPPHIGDPGPRGRILVRGEPGWDIIPQLTPIAGEFVVDKPGKGAFCRTELEGLLNARGISTLIVAGVTTEVCVQTSVREANDRGYECLVLEDCTASYFPAFHQATLEMVVAQGGIVGWVGSSADVLKSLGESRSAELLGWVS